MSKPEEAIEDNSNRPHITILPSGAPKNVGKAYTKEDFEKECKRDSLKEFSHLTSDQIFDVPAFPPNNTLCIMDIEAQSALFRECAELAIREHNQENNSGYKLTEIVKAVGTPFGGVVHLMYTAKESEDGIPLTFKTKFTISRFGKHVIQSTSYS